MSVAGARIGPNAVTQVAAAVERGLGRGAVRDLFAAVGLCAYLEAPPCGMVDEREVIALHAAVRERLAARTARAIAVDAGTATADYLLAQRIPRLVQALLRRLPAGLASRLLLAAIARHAWTFAGSGTFRARPGRPIEIAIHDCPLCRGARAGAPVCDYYAATFTRLFARLVHPLARAREVTCGAEGAPACRFEVDWPASTRG
jgi:divinyl protochlorophyllide a 8-vinyl-reductase